MSAGRDDRPLRMDGIPMIVGVAFFHGLGLGMLRAQETLSGDEEHKLSDEAIRIALDRLRAMAVEERGGK